MFNWFVPKVFNSGYLPEQDGHKIFYMEAGNPKGQPIIVFHGGPGGSAKEKHAYPYDRKKYRIILFDQRGCGRSIPAGEFKNNTTQDLLSDVDRLLEHLNIKGKIVLSGRSWGSTLALLYAIKNPKRVEKMILSMVFLADKQCRDWEEKYSNWFYPDIWEKIIAEIPSTDSVAKEYAKLINSKNLVDQVKSASLYANYERVLGCLDPKLDIQELGVDDINSAKIYINYAAKKFMLEDNEIIQHIDNIKNIPTLITHNRLDLLCPLDGAWQVHKKLKKSKLVIVSDLGHYSEKLVRITNQEIKKFL